MCTSQRPGIRYPPLRSIICASPALPASPLGRMADSAIFDQHGTIRPYLGLDAVDQVCMRKDCLHYGLSRLKLEILGSNTATEAQIGVADKRACWSSGDASVCAKSGRSY